MDCDADEPAGVSDRPVDENGATQDAEAADDGGHTARTAGIAQLRCDRCDFTTGRPSDMRSHVRTVHEARALRRLLRKRDALHCCKMCDFTTAHRESVQRHVKLVHGDGPLYHCSHCSYSGKSKGYLMKHVAQIHGPDEEKQWHRCDVCDYKTVRYQSLKEHVLNKHTSEEDCEMLRCDRCEYTTHSKVNLRRHLRSHKRGDAEPLPAGCRLADNLYECAACGRKFAALHMWHRHNRLAHGRDERSEWYQCDLCDVTRATMFSLTEHKITKHGVADANAEPPAWVKKRQMGKKQVIKCPQCLFKCHSVKVMEQHENAVHTPADKVHHCDTCSYMFTSAERLRNHRTVHAGGARKPVTKWMQCDMCNYKAVHHMHMTRHLNYHHPNGSHYGKLKGEAHEKKYACEHPGCTYASAYIAGIYEHTKRRHLGCTPHNGTGPVASQRQDRLHKCDKCDFSATLQSSLQRHTTVFHPADPTERPHRCADCGYTSKWKQNLDRHVIQKHTPDEQINWLTCDTCGYKAKIMDRLKIHKCHSAGRRRRTLVLAASEAAGGDEPAQADNGELDGPRAQLDGGQGAVPDAQGDESAVGDEAVHCADEGHAVAHAEQGAAHPVDAVDGVRLLSIDGIQYRCLDVQSETGAVATSAECGGNLNNVPLTPGVHRVEPIHGGYFVCGLCNYRTVSHFWLEQHALCYHWNRGDDLTAFTCGQCKWFTTDDFVHVLMHRLAFHNDTLLNSFVEPQFRLNGKVISCDKAVVTLDSIETMG